MAIVKTRPGFLVSEHDSRIVRFYARRVTAGVRLLEQKVPAWKTKVSLTDLNLSSPNFCVLGQAIAKNAFVAAGFDLDEVSHDYDGAVEVLDIDGQAFGFDVSSEKPGDIEERAEYQILNHLWTEAIRLVRAGERVTIGALLGRA